METSLRCRSEEPNLYLHAKENFVSEGNIVLQVHGKLNTATGTPSASIQLRKKFFPPQVLTALDVAARCEVTPSARAVSYCCSGKKTWELTDNGLLALDLKGSYSFNANDKAGVPRAVVELSQKVFNFTDDQDLKLKLGVNLIQKRPYLQIRENNWTVNAELRGGSDVAWSVIYDL